MTLILNFAPLDYFQTILTKQLSTGMWMSRTLDLRIEDIYRIVPDIRPINPKLICNLAYKINLQ